MCLRLKHILYILQQVYKMNCIKICLWHKPCANKIGFCNKVIIYFNVNIPLGDFAFYNNVLCTNMLTELKDHVCFRIPFYSALSRVINQSSDSMFSGTSLNIKNIAYVSYMFLKKSAYNFKLSFHSFTRKRPRKGSQLIDF